MKINYTNRLSLFDKNHQYEDQTTIKSYQWRDALQICLRMIKRDILTQAKVIVTQIKILLAITD